VHCTSLEFHVVADVGGVVPAPVAKGGCSFGLADVEAAPKGAKLVPLVDPDVGRNSTGYLVDDAAARTIYFHVRGIPAAHWLMIRTTQLSAAEVTAMAAGVRPERGWTLPGR